MGRTCSAGRKEKLVAEIMALAASVCFAIGTVLQQKGTLQAPSAGGDPRFLIQILGRPVWWAGGLLQGAGWVLQAAALDRGSLMVVQSICTLSLVFALPLGMRITHQRVGRREVAGAIAVVLGIVLFVSVAATGSGTGHPSNTAWWIAGILTVAAIGVLMGLGWSGTGGRQALLFGLAAGCAFAFQAAVTKVFVGELHQGIGTILSSWTTYALIISAMLGFTLQQSALKTGVLAPAMASSNAMTLFASTLLGAIVFDERLAHGDGRLVPAVVGLVMALVGVSFLAGEEEPAGPSGGNEPHRPDAATDRSRHQGSGRRAQPTG
jgi:drug/metabolite transporter (DMT)-like permease